MSSLRCPDSRPHNLKPFSDTYYSTCRPEFAVGSAPGHDKAPRQGTCNATQIQITTTTATTLNTLTVGGWLRRRRCCMGVKSKSERVTVCQKPENCAISIWRAHLHRHNTLRACAAASCAVVMMLRCHDGEECYNEPSRLLWVDLCGVFCVCVC